ncbi:hypothetical protein FOZ63_012354 [Perkinsus olseni]|uniref:Uncharacterized protein n=1 Tax=Perkinsus olseni TaxID=32597 RepID=A0A7J6R4G9_PEROL|nr:hypothetical protein FOZ63_012354 [Perkinsus olseni]KAF4743644.1 hypothetical protein FOZ62_012399 [Perkinsus olseni]
MSEQYDPGADDRPKELLMTAFLCDLTRMNDFISDSPRPAHGSVISLDSEDELEVENAGQQTRPGRTLKSDSDLDDSPGSPGDDHWSEADDVDDVLPSKYSKWTDEEQGELDRALIEYNHDPQRCKKMVRDRRFK